MEEIANVNKEPTIEELQEIIEQKETSISYWMNECLKSQKKYENLKQLIKSLSTIID